MNKIEHGSLARQALVLLNLHPSSFILTNHHAKINKNSKSESVTGRHIRADLNRDLDLSDPQRVRRSKPLREKAAFEGSLF